MLYNARGLSCVTPGTVIEVHAYLVKLFAVSFPHLTIRPLPVGQGTATALPKPEGTPYRADPSLVRHYRDRLPPNPIGVCWSADALPEMKSVCLTDLAPIYLRFPTVSLQAGPNHLDWVGTPVLSVLPAHPDFHDAAALIAACRAVVTVDTAIWHLAAGMGVENIHLAIRQPGIYRAGQPDCVYPSTTVHRIDAGFGARIASNL